MCDIPSTWERPMPTFQGFLIDDIKRCEWEFAQ